MSLEQPGTPRSLRLSGAAPAAELPVRSTLETLFLESTVVWASATALLGDEGRLCYSDLMVRGQNIAAVLRRAGMQHGDLVGVVGLRTFSSISAIVGILLAGGVYVPFDVHGQPPERLARQRDESAIRLLLTDGTDPAGQALDWAGNTRIIDAALVEREFMPPFGEVRLPHRLPEDPAVVVFNQANQGVLVTHAGIVRLVTTGVLLEFRSADTVLLHSGAQEHAFQLELWGPLLAGGTVALAPGPVSGAGTAMLPHEYARVMRRYRVSALCARPMLLEQLAREPLAPLEQVNQAVVDAAELEPSLLGRLRGGERGLRLTGGLGAAETTSFAVRVQVNVEQDGHAEPLPGSEAIVVLPNGSEAAAGALGALAITGDALAIGYLGQPETTLASFPETQRQNQQRLRSFRLAVHATRLLDGTLLTGAAAIAAAGASNRHAIRIPAAEVEALLLAHPLVEECIALAAAPTERVRCVFATLRRRDDPRAERTLREHLEAALPESAQPAALVLLAELPRTAEGEVDRARLEQQCEALLRRHAPEHPAPETPPEQYTDVVRGVWQRLLHRMRVDPDEDIYAGGGGLAGGNSVQRIRLYAELNRRFPGAFTIADLRSLNTMRKVVAHLNSDEARERMLALERRGA